MNKKILVISVISLLAISILSQDAYASVLSASMKNPPQSTADIFTLNNTVGTPLYHIDHAGKVFAANNVDFHNSTVSFDSSKILIRNPASTFAYTITGGAIVANRTLNIPVITGTDTISTLGLAQTNTAAKTFSGGIVMSSSDISLGTNKITTSNYNFNQTTALGQTTMFIKNSGANANTFFTLSPSGSSTSSMLMISRVSDVTTNKEWFYFGSDIATTGEYGLQIQAAGTGSLRPFNVYMQATKEMSFDNPSSVTAYVDFFQTTGKKITYNVGGTTYGIESSAGVLDFYSNSNNNIRLDANSNVILGPQSNLTTSATNGFTYVRTTAGTPSGVATSITGHEPLLYDGTHNKLCVYNGAWKCVTLS